jgi:hypothetical protein
LAGVGVLAFVAFERDGKKANADESRSEEYDGQNEMGGFKTAQEYSDLRIAGRIE